MATAPDVLPVVTAADDVPGPPQGQWTYADYAALPDDGQRYEVVDGVLYMAPAPGEAHQSTSARLVTHLMTYVEFAGLGRVYHASFDVTLAPDVTVQPDVVVVLNANSDIITPSGIVGVPDLVVEIASPSTATHDRSRKMLAYARAGVQEYWIADPHARTVELHVLHQGSYQSRGVFQGQATLPSTVVSGLPVRVHQFFA